MASYVSEATQFINQYKKDHPDTEKRQREGRLLLWDKEIDLEQQEQYKAARVPQKALCLSQQISPVCSHSTTLMSVGESELAQLHNPTIDSTPSTVDNVALARLYGEPLFNVPQDLYIPPDALQVFLEAFEGPLDLLLYLIRKQNFNVLDIPMAEVTQQYLGYVEQIREHNLELAAEYLLMAAMLIEIKSRMLLPIKKSDTDEEVDDPRAELVRRLLEYEKMKLAARHLDEQPQIGRDFQRSRAYKDVEVEQLLPEVSPDDLKQAWAEIMRRAKLNKKHHISREQFSVREHMGHILRRLGGVRFMEFKELFIERIDSGETAAVVVVHFLALLELARESLVEITQAEPYAPIYVRLAYISMTEVVEN